jgi:peptidyl-tRNA hydrolase, PTH1 family
MKLIIGLGNPGTDYEKTRHNVGFMAIDCLRRQIEADAFKLNKKLKAEISSGNCGDEKIILAKPQTFMNSSGESVKALVDFYKIKPADLWVIYDDSDLPLEKIRIGKFKSSGGHHGIESIITHLKKTELIRFKIGIRPQNNDKKALTFILKNFSGKEKTILNRMIEKTISAIKDAMTEPLEKVMSKYN